MYYAPHVHVLHVYPRRPHELDDLCLSMGEAVPPRPTPPTDASCLPGFVVPDFQALTRRQLVAWISEHVGLLAPEYPLPMLLEGDVAMLRAAARECEAVWEEWLDDAIAALAAGKVGGTGEGFKACLDVWVCWVMGSGVRLVAWMGCRSLPALASRGWRRGRGTAPTHGSPLPPTGGAQQAPVQAGSGCWQVWVPLRGVCQLQGAEA